MNPSHLRLKVLCYFNYRAVKELYFEIKEFKKKNHYYYINSLALIFYICVCKNNKKHNNQKKFN